MKLDRVDIRLAEASPGRYRVVVDPDPGGTATEEVVALDPTSGVFRGLQERLAALDIEADEVTRLGLEIYDALFPDGARGGRRLLERIVRAARAEPATGVRVLLRDLPPEVGRLALEAAAAAPERPPLVAAPGISVARFVEVDRPVLPPRLPRPIHLLVFAPGGGTIDVDAEVAEIEAALAPLGDGVVLRVIRRREATPDALRAELTRSEGAPSVVSFVGHGAYDAENGGRLRLDDGSGGEAWVGTEELARVVAQAPALRLLVLNACETGTVSPYDAFAGLAPALVRAGPPAVIAMQVPVTEGTARAFAVAFYRALLRGEVRGRVDLALTQARAALWELRRPPASFAAPVLYLRAAEAIVFDVPESVWTPRAILGDGEVDRLRGLLSTSQGDERWAAERGEPEGTSREQLAADRAAWTRQLWFLLAARAAAFVAAGLAFLTLWTGALDRVGLRGALDGVGLRSVSDAMTLAAWGSWAEAEPAPGVQAILYPSSGDPSEQVATRRRVAHLVEAVAGAGADVIAVTTAFKEQDDGIAPLVDAIGVAHRAGAKVVLGMTRARPVEECVSEVPGRYTPCLAPRLLEAADAFGVSCFPDRFEQTDLLLVLPVVHTMSDGLPAWPTLAVSARLAGKEQLVRSPLVITDDFPDMTLASPAWEPLPVYATTIRQITGSDAKSCLSDDRGGVTRVVPVRWTAPDSTTRLVEAEALAEIAAGTERYRGATVFIGPARGDNGTYRQCPGCTPLQSAEADVILWSAMERGGFVRPPPPGLAAVAIAGSALGALWLGLHGPRRRWLRWGGLGGLVLGWVAVSGVVFAMHTVLLDFIDGVLAVVLPYLAVRLVRRRLAWRPRPTAAS